MAIFGARAQKALPKSHISCTFCSMSIKDELHAAQIDQHDSSLFFGSIECMMNYLSAHPNVKKEQLFIADYNDNGNFIEAKNAFYLQSRAIKSPMGENLTGFSTRKAAEKATDLKGDQIFDWDQLQEKFSGPATGLMLHDHSRPDAHAPIGVMGDHLHHQGSLMFSFRYMNMQMQGLQHGTEELDNADVLAKYMMAPEEMDMNMYMLGLMYAPSSNLTLMLMQSYLSKDMDMQMKMLMSGMPVYTSFSTASSGWGDLSLQALYGIFSIGNTSLHLNAGLSLPLGSIDRRDDTPMADNARLPYPMQLSSGTFDLLLGSTFKQTFEDASWGAQFMATLRTGENDNDYRLGNSYKLNTWAAYRLLTNLSLSGRIMGSTTNGIKGADPELNPMMSPTANASYSGGELVKAFAGFNIAFSQTSFLKDLRLGAEAGYPVYANYNGIQMDEELSFILGLKYSIL